MKRSTNYPHGVRVAACAHLQCNRPRHARGLCESHWIRAKEGRSITTPLRIYTKHPPRPRICSVYRCTDPQYLDLLCVRHFRHSRLHSPAFRLNAGTTSNEGTPHG